MNVIVRLYWQHDLDLVALAAHPMFEMGKWLKKAMIAYTEGDVEFHIPLPPEMPPEKLLVNSDAHFALDPNNESEAKVIAVLQKFRNGQRNSAIKHIFRRYLDNLFLNPYFDTVMYQVKARGNYGEKTNKVATLGNEPPKTIPPSKPAEKPKISKTVQMAQSPKQEILISGSTQQPSINENIELNPELSEPKDDATEKNITNVKYDESAAVHMDNTNPDPIPTVSDTTDDSIDEEFNLFSTIENLI